MSNYLPCYICYDRTDPEFICDTCNRLYCEGCTYTYSLHYQHQGSRCFKCSDQSRINVLTKEELRNNKANYIISIDGKR